MSALFCGYRALSFKHFIIISCIALLSACGGGGSKGASDKTPPSGSSNTPAATTLVANAGADLSVKAGEKITLDPKAQVVGAANFKSGQGNLEITGASSNAGDIVAIAWTRIEGPVVALQTTSTTNALVSFIAPATGSEASIKISYKLTITNAAGTKAEDTVTFTILKVNQAPSVDAGPDQTVDGLAPVSVVAKAADADGSIASYQWQQTAGNNVELKGEKTSSLSFVAPSTSVALTLEFELTVTDSDGSSSKDKVAIVVNPENAPVVQLYFPSQKGVYTGAQISATGVAVAKTGSISGVSVDIGAGPVAATVNADGTWRVDGLTVPAAVSEFSLQVIATDTVGRTGKTSANLKVTGEKAGGKVANGLSWSETVGVAVDSSKNIAYVLATGIYLKDVRVFPIDLTTGVQGADISNFSDVSKGINSSALKAMTYDAKQHRIYASTNPADTTNLKPEIISIDTLTGERKLVSGFVRGSGEKLSNPTGLAMGADNKLYVADNGKSMIFAVDTETGDRVQVAGPTTLAYAIDAPLLLASDVSGAANRLFMIPNARSNFVLQLDLAVNPVSSTLVTDSNNSAQGSVTLRDDPQGMVVSSKLNSVFVNDQIVNSQIVQINLATGNRTKLTVTQTSGSRIGYDHKRELLYIADGIIPGLYVVDPIKGQKVLISRD